MIADADAIVTGFFGKLPSRGDFVRAGLPTNFVVPWDEWLQTVLPASRAVLDKRWLPAWMEAPIWFFALHPGACGPKPAVGVWMPSVDRAGRHFPLTIAAVGRGVGAGAAADWLARAEQGGLDALEQDLSPDALTASLGPPPPTGGDHDSLSRTLWWSAGGPRVAADRRGFEQLPTGEEFAKMLDDAT